MDGISILDSLVTQAQTAEENQAKRDQARIRDITETLRAKTIELLGEAWTALAEHMEEKTEVFNRGQQVNILWSLLPGHTHVLRMAPFEIRSSTYAYEKKIKVWNDNGYGWIEYEISQLGRALFKARSTFPAYAGKITESFISNRRKFFDFWDNRDEAAVRKAHGELVEAIPDRKQEWDEKLSYWLQVAEGQRKSDEQLAREKEEHQARLEAFKQAYLAWWISRENIFKHNRLAMEHIQEQFNTPFDVWELTYAIYARDGEEDAGVETRTAWVSRPDSVNGEYLLTTGQTRKYFNPVCLEKHTVKPTDQIGGTYQTCHVHGATLWVSSTADLALVQAVIDAAGFMPLPEQPKPSEDLAWYEVDLIKDSVRKAKVNEDDVPF